MDEEEIVQENQIDESTNKNIDNSYSQAYIPSKNEIPIGLLNKNNNSDLFHKNAKENNQKKDSGLEKKDELKDKNEENDKDNKKDNKEDKKEDNKNKINTNSSLFKKDNDSKDDEKGFFKGKLKKLKFKLILCGVIASLFISFFIVSYFLLAFNTLMTSVISFFGIKEYDKSDTGLWSDEKYFVDNNGNIIDVEDYVTSDGTKVEGIISTLSNNSCNPSWIESFIDSNFNQNFANDPCRLLNFINKYSEKKENSYPGLSIDKSLIIATIFYAYDDEKGDISASNNYEVLKDVLSNGIITRNDVEDIIESTIYKNKYSYYIEEDGKCVEKKVNNYYSSLDRWKIFMTTNTNIKDFEKNKNNNNSYLNSSKACREEKGLYLVDLNENTSTDYRNGFVYKKYPSFSSHSYSDEQIKKRVDDIITNIEERKVEFDEILFGIKPTTNNKFNLNGDLIKSNEALTITNYCTLVNQGKASLLQVNVTDCQDNQLAILSLKEYILGVTIAEIGYKVEPNYVKTQMSASISYTLGRRNNYTKTTGFSMRSGSCDQNWCDIYNGCHRTEEGGYYYDDGRVLKATVSGPDSNGNYYKYAMTSEQLNTYSDYFDDAIYYVIGSADAGYKGSYVDVTQKSWKEKASRGMNFVDILKEEYEPSGKTIYDCRKINNTSVSTNSTITNMPEVASDTGNAKVITKSLIESYNNSYNQTYSKQIVEISQMFLNTEVGKASTFVNTVLLSVANTLNINMDIEFTSVMDLFNNYGKCNGVISKNLKPGDLIFYATNDISIVDHVAIFAGYDKNGNMIKYETNTIESKKLTSSDIIPARVKETSSNIVGYARIYPNTNTCN